MKYLCLLFLAVLLVCCSTDSVPTVQETFPELMIPSTPCLPQKATASSIITADYTPLYIGQLKDTLSVSYFFTTALPPPPPPPPLSYLQTDSLVEQQDTIWELPPNPFEDYINRDWLTSKYYTYWDSAVIDVQINTTTTIKSYKGTSCMIAYPVLLQSSAPDTIWIGYSDQIPLLLEALNEANEWKPIQRKYIYGCGVGLAKIFLPPKAVVLVSCPIFEGNYHTLLRLKIGQNYSKPFEGNIRLKQFDRE